MVKKKRRQKIRFIIKSKQAKAFVSKYRKRGVSDLLIGKALLWAHNQAIGVVKQVTDDPKEFERLMRSAKPRALVKAEKWIEGVME